MVIVTGAAGFIGYQLAKSLKDTRHRVIGVDELLFFESRTEHSDLQLHRRASPEEILEDSFFEELLGQGTPVRAIFHMGACSDTTELRTDFLKRVNVDYSKRLWELSIRYQIPFIYASSAATYGAGEEGYSDDDCRMHLLKPLNPYGASKLEFDLWTLSESGRGSEPPAWCGFKFFNVYGFGERHKGRQSSVVLQGFDQINSSGTIRLFRSHREGIADGEQKRDFIYVRDVVEALLFAWTKPVRRGVFNLGSGQARSFLDLARATFAAMGREPQVVFIDTPVEIRDRYQYFTEAIMDRLRQEGFTRPFTPLERGVQETIHALQLRSC
ncbi:ADP-glyceromanno-heptose 6-epimerase [bacterium]|jgi:ADP-L-glycero-D-manno-heptose 6-epimerase|nr:ADP-glyceromanno-heptose 6-epimerase [bacterium]